MRDEGVASAARNALRTVLCLRVLRPKRPRSCSESTWSGSLVSWSMPPSHSVTVLDISVETPMTVPGLSKQPPTYVGFAMQADESQSKSGQLFIVIQQSPPSVGDDGWQNERREEEVNTSRRQLHDSDRAAQSLDNAVHAVFKDVVGFGGIDLAIVSPSDSTFRLSESVTEAHGSGKTWPDGNLTSAKSRQDLRPWLNNISLGVSVSAVGEKTFYHALTQMIILVLQISIHDSAHVIRLENIASIDTLPVLQQNWC